jgi:hypothetical protein
VVIPPFKRRPATHVVIERSAKGPWIEHARFPNAVDAADYAIWRRRRHEESVSPSGVEIQIVLDAVDTGVPAIGLARGLPNSDYSETEDPSDGRTVASMPKFDS